MLIDTLLALTIAVTVALIVMTPRPGSIDDRRSMHRWRHVRRAIDRIAPIREEDQ